MNLIDLCKNRFNEISDLYNEVNRLGFKDNPQYEKYINILSRNKEINDSEIKNKECFCWIKKLKNKIKDNEEQKKELEKDKEIKDLFKGYPIEYTKNYIDYF